MRFATRSLCLLAIIVISLGFQAQVQAQCCDVYKASFLDYAPQGLPDFDQKQSTWQSGSVWTHCGPVAVANCLWWFDSRFETIPVDPRPFGGTPWNDNYLLVTSYNGPANDDHDPVTVVDLVTELAIRMRTDASGLGTGISDMQTGERQYRAAYGLLSDYTDTMVAYPSDAEIDQYILQGCNVILLIGFYEDPLECCRVGGHYVTVAGVCTTGTEICVSDPWLDALEGEPPAGSAHGAGVHNDADFISGPHSQVQHDRYSLTASNPPCLGVIVELVDYPMGPAELANFEGQNEDDVPCTPAGGPTIAVVEYAYVICPTVATDVGRDGSGVRPGHFGLGANYPNPFNAQTAFDYSISEPGFVSLVVYNALGQQVRVLVQESKAPGVYRSQWNGVDQVDQEVPSGIYFYRLQSGTFAETRKMLLLK